ncbi:hypothetical protein LB505_005404 [Fusarium chuoi]|nr:hypothetical protein LB505_005404 [Fusarium chuoi]
MASYASDIDMASDASGNETPPIEKVPPEVLSYALSFLPDRASIRAAMLSGPKLYNAFKQRPAYISSCVLFNSMEEPVYREAVNGRASKLASRLSIASIPVNSSASTASSSHSTESRRCGAFIKLLNTSQNVFLRP